jgi:hypothetical protein
VATDDGDDGDAPVELHAATTAAMAKLATSKVLERMAKTSISMGGPSSEPDG